ncbi:MAG: protein kinase [Endozoicomonas sp. (ex Botrylloides leachii)]|nr:protein kinase [Endozoicomonas sp. (ex Botrylloides leachii)]
MEPLNQSSILENKSFLKVKSCEMQGDFLGKKVKLKHVDHKLLVGDKNEISTVFDKNNKRDLKEKYSTLVPGNKKKSTANILIPNNSRNVSDYDLKRYLENIYDRVKNKNTSIKKAAINDLKKLFSEKIIPATQLNKILISISINETWAFSCLYDSEMQQKYMSFTEYNTSDLADQFAEIILTKMEENFEANKHDGENIFGYDSLSSGLQGKPMPEMELEIYWSYNREDKREKKLPFTRVQGENLAGQLFTAELLNSVPDEVLKQYGWSEQEIDILPINKNKKYLSDAAKVNLNLEHINYENNFRYFGLGSFGKVKLARIHLSNGKELVCVAKKIVGKEDSLSDLNKEIKLQNQSGVAPKVYGIADTVNKENKRQFIVFMEAAKGCDGFDYINQQYDKMTMQDRYRIAENYLNKIQVMHRNGVFHQDIKFENSVIDPKTKAVQILDFGLAEAYGENQENGQYDQSSFYNPPEFIEGGKYSKGDYDKERGDVFSLGLLLGSLFSTQSYFDIEPFTEWDSLNSIDPESKIERMLADLKIDDTQMHNLIKRMTSANPKERPTMAEVIDDFQQLKAMQGSDSLLTTDAVEVTNKIEQ